MTNLTVARASSSSALAIPGSFKMNLVNTVSRWCGLSALALSLVAQGASPALTSLNNLPLCFEAAPGQQFVARGLNYQFLIAPVEVQIVLSQRTAGKPGVTGQG